MSSCKHCEKPLGPRNRTGFCSNRCRYRGDPDYRKIHIRQVQDSHRRRYHSDPEYRERYKATVRARMRRRYEQHSQDPAWRAWRAAYQAEWYVKRCRADPEYVARQRENHRRWERRRRGVPIEDRFCVYCGCPIRPTNRSGYCRRNECQGRYHRLRRRTDPEYRAAQLASERDRRRCQGAQIAKYKRQYRSRRLLQRLAAAAQAILEEHGDGNRQGC